MPTPRKGYFSADGLRLPSVTTIIGRFKESGALLRWAYNQGLAGVELYEKRDAAADVGTYVHALVEACLLTGATDAAPPPGMSDENVAKARTAFSAFRAWHVGSRLTIKPLERHLVSEIHRYGGTPDAIAEEADSKKLSLVDWKSSKNFYWDNLLQLAAYVELWNENRPERPITGGIHVVRFGKEGADFEHRWFPIDHPKLGAAWKQFLLYRQAYDLDRFICSKDA